MLVGVVNCSRFVASCRAARLQEVNACAQTWRRAKCEWLVIVFIRDIAVLICIYVTNLAEREMRMFSVRQGCSYIYIYISQTWRRAKDKWLVIVLVRDIAVLICICHKPGGARNGNV